MFYACPSGSYAPSTGSSMCSLITTGNYVPFPGSPLYLSCGTALLAGASVCNAGSGGELITTSDMKLTDSHWIALRLWLLCLLWLLWLSWLLWLCCVTGTGSGCAPGTYYTGWTCAAVPAGA